MEVKYRQSIEKGVLAVDAKSQSRIRRAAEQYLLVDAKESHKLNYDIRFDVVIVTKFFLIKHIKNAF